MNKSEAITMLQADDQLTPELIRHNYGVKFLHLYRNKVNAVLNEEADNLDRKMLELNEAYGTLRQHAIAGHSGFDYDFGQLPLIGADTAYYRTEPIPEFLKLIECSRELMKDKKYGLAFRLIETGIFKSLNDPKFKHSISTKHLLRCFGSVLTKVGMVAEGVQFMNDGAPDYYKGQTFFEIGDYRTAIQYFGEELKKKETMIDKQDVALSIAKCYFLLREYENCLQVLESILPNLVPRSKLFNAPIKSKKHGKIMLLSIHLIGKLQGQPIDRMRAKILYPVTMKFIQKCFGSVNDAVTVLKEYRNNSEKVEAFMESITPVLEIDEQAHLEYDIEQLQRHFFEIFDEPMNQSLIYHKK